MSNVVDRLKRVMSYSEISAFKAIYAEMGQETEVTLVNSKIGDKLGITRSIIVNCLKLLEVAGVLETRSMGMKGTYIKVLDKDALQSIANF